MKRIINAPFKFMRSLYDWTLHWAKTKNSNYALLGIAFMEASLFPIPPDALLIPMVVSKPKFWYKTSLICTIGSVCGAFLGYAIGRIFYDTVGLAIVNFYGLQHAISVVGEKYANNAFLTIFVGGFTPIPYKSITITAGMFDISLPTLFIASIFGRGGRFFIIAIALKFFGKKVQDTIEKYFNVISFAFLALLVAGFLTLKYLI